MAITCDEHLQYVIDVRNDLERVQTEIVTHNDNVAAANRAIGDLWRKESELRSLLDAARGRRLDVCGDEDE